MLSSSKASNPGAPNPGAPNPGDADREGLSSDGLGDLIDLNRSLLSELSSLQALLDNPPPEPDGGRSELRRRFAATLRELRRSRDELDRLGDHATSVADSPREVGS